MYTIGFSFQVKATIFPTSIEKRDYMTYVPYASMAGNLMYAMVCTRPDLSQAISMIIRNIHDPG